MKAVASPMNVAVSLSRPSNASRRSLLAGSAPRTSSRRSGVIVHASAEAESKNLEIMRKFSEQYARTSGTYFCVDKGVTAVVIQGLAAHKDELGHYDDKKAETENGFWNCPCVPMRERKECHCMLFLSEDNDFAGKEQTLTMEELKDLTKGM